MCRWSCTRDEVRALIFVLCTCCADVKIVNKNYLKHHFVFIVVINNCLRHFPEDLLLTLTRSLLPINTPDCVQLLQAAKHLNNGAFVRLSFRPALPVPFIVAE